MCPKSALQCQLTSLYVLYTVNPSPLPPRSNTNCHESSENFLSKNKQVLGKLPILKVPKCEIFDRSDFHYFYTIKPFWVDDFVVKILTYYFNFWGSQASFSF